MSVFLAGAAQGADEAVTLASLEMHAEAAPQWPRLELSEDHHLQDGLDAKLENLGLASKALVGATLKRDAIRRKRQGNGWILVATAPDRPGRGRPLSPPARGARAR